MNERRAFQPTSEDENIVCAQIGIEIFKMLKARYPEQNSKDYDMILNSICSSMIVFLRASVAEEDCKAALQLIYQILNKNL